MSGTADSSNTNVKEVLKFKDFEDLSLYLDTEELLLPEEERLDVENMIEKRQQDLIVDQDRFDVWYDKITRRRMFALARLRKLTHAYKDRIKFYDEVKLQLENKSLNKNTNDEESYASSPFQSDITQSVTLTIATGSSLSNTVSRDRLASDGSESTMGTKITQVGVNDASSFKEAGVVPDRLDASTADTLEEKNTKALSLKKENTPYIDEVTYKT